MTRIPEKLRAQLERAAKRANRSMNAELIHRLELTFRATDLTDKLRTEVRDFETTVADEKVAMANLTAEMEAARAEMVAAKDDTLDVLRQAKGAMDKLLADDIVDRLPSEVQARLEEVADAFTRKWALDRREAPAEEKSTKGEDRSSAASASAHGKPTARGIKS